MTTTASKQRRLVFYGAAAVCGVAVTGSLFVLHSKFGMRLRNHKFTMNAHNVNSTGSPLLSSMSLPSTFSVLSQNVWCSFVYYGAHRQQRLQLLYENIIKDAPDVICLQELFIFSIGFAGVMLCGDFEYLHQRLVDSGYTYFNDPTETLPYLFGGNSGLMLYSKYPMTSVKSQAFDAKWRRMWSAKGFVSAVFRTANNNHKNNANTDVNATTNPAEDTSTLNIVNTHLEHENRDFIKQQITQIMNAMRMDMDMDTTNDNKTEELTEFGFDYRLLLGDFNICSQFTKETEYEFPHRTYDILLENVKNIGLDNDLFFGFDRTYRVTDKEPNASYDHMFVDSALKQCVVQQEIKDYKNTKNENTMVVSDHYGLMAQFSIFEQSRFLN